MRRVKARDHWTRDQGKGPTWYCPHLVRREPAEPDDIVENPVDRIVGRCAPVADIKDGAVGCAEVIWLACGRKDHRSGFAV